MSATSPGVKLCRFRLGSSAPRIGLALSEDELLDLRPAGVECMEPLLDEEDLLGKLEGFARLDLPHHSLGSVRLLPPVERQEVWAAGVTYLRSKTARMDESEFSASAYDKVYDAERPELFFKSLPEKVVGPHEPVGIRRDSKWNVPEPELALIINSLGKIVGFTIGNDMSSRDIEGENLLYLPQAKMYHRSCALGPFITVGVSEAAARQWTIYLEIIREGKPAFQGETRVDQIKRRFEELAGFLFRSQVFPHGAVLLTGTGIVPAESFTLAEGDLIRMTISGIGTLINPVVPV